MPTPRRTKRATSKFGDVAMQVRRDDTAGPASSSGVDPKQAKRALLAEFCRLIGDRKLADMDPPPSRERAGDVDVVRSVPADELTGEIATLPPRQRQTLLALLEGDSEKQIAIRLSLSPNTVHVYVKSLYRRFNVASRGELLARWVRTARP
jgi:DNA-binding NarL/FixJ family response regulator